MPTGGGIPGLAVAMVAAGAVVTWSGIRNATIADTLRAVIRGQPVPATPQRTALGVALGQAAAQAAQLSETNRLAPAGGGGVTGTSLPPGSTGSAIVEAARRYIGTPYAWARADPQGMDCSGLVNLVVGHDLGQPIPGHPDGKFSGHGPVTTEWLVWSGATTISGLDAAPGDLVCWPSHIGIYAGNGRMINAPTFGESVKVDTIWTIPTPTYRRLASVSRLAAR